MFAEFGTNIPGRYQFAVLLAAFRTCLRSGALWFIKDPQDQNFHPIREILDRPALVHIRKLIVSGFMYGFVIACSVGTVSAILRVFSQTIMPFRWKLRYDFALFFFVTLV